MLTHEQEDIISRLKELRKVVGDKLRESITDADVMHHTFKDLTKPVKDKELARYLALRQEFGLPVQE